MSGLRRLGPLVAVGLLLAAAAVSATLASPQVRPRRYGVDNPPPLGDHPSFDQRYPTAPPQDATGLAEPSRTTQLPDWLLFTAQLICVLLVTAAVGLLVWYLLRNGLRLRHRRHEPKPAAEPAPDRSEVIAAVDAGLSDLDDLDTDPRRAVIACWVRLEQAAAAAGTPRHVGDTPTELVTRLLAGHAVSAAGLYSLAEVYRLARYATHTVDTTTRDQARAALGQLRAELSREREPVS